MRSIALGLTATVLLAGCSGETAEKPVEKKAEALKPGEYEIASKVDAVRVTDNSGSPATKSKVGDVGQPVRTCIAADGAIDPKVFVAAGETCTPASAYLRNGRMSLQYQCTQPDGQVTQMVDGQFKEESFEARVITSTFLSGAGDYEMTRSFTGKRVGDCPAGTAAKG